MRTFGVIHRLDSGLHLCKSFANRRSVGRQSNTPQASHKRSFGLTTFRCARVHATVNALPQKVITRVQVWRVLGEVHRLDAQIFLCINGSVAFVPGRVVILEQEVLVLDTTRSAWWLPGTSRLLPGRTSVAASRPTSRHDLLEYLRTQ